MSPSFCVVIYKQEITTLTTQIAGSLWELDEKIHVKPLSNACKERLAPSRSSPPRGLFPPLRKHWWKRGDGKLIPTVSLEEKGDSSCLAGLSRGPAAFWGPPERWMKLDFQESILIRASPRQRLWCLSKIELSLPSRGQACTGSHQCPLECLAQRWSLTSSLTCREHPLCTTRHGNRAPALSKLTVWRGVTA